MPRFRAIALAAIFCGAALVRPAAAQDAIQPAPTPPPLAAPSAPLPDPAEAAWLGEDSAPEPATANPAAPSPPRRDLEFRSFNYDGNSYTVDLSPVYQPALDRVTEQVTPEERPAFDAFLASLTVPQTNALLRTTDRMDETGERGVFVNFLIALPAAQRARMIDFIEAVANDNRKALANQFRINPRENWSAIPDLLETASKAEAVLMVFGHVPCTIASIPGHGPWMRRCKLPAGTDAFYAKWLIIYGSRPVWALVAPHGSTSPSALAPWQAQIFKFGKDAPKYTADQEAAEFKVYKTKLTDYERGHLCGGSLIKPGWVLTAAHCIVPPQDSTRIEDYLTQRKVRMGTMDIGGGGGKEWAIDGIVVHGRANTHAPHLGNDLALLHIVAPQNVPGKIDPKQLVTVTPIRPAAPDMANPPATEPLYVSGWGVTGIAEQTRQLLDEHGAPQVAPRYMQTARLQYLAPDRCNHDRRFIAKKYAIKAGQLCAGSPGTDTSCWGDSGGPLVAKDGKGYVLLGVVSYGIGCGGIRAPSAFADVRAYGDWLEQAPAHYQRGKVVFWAPPPR